VHCHARAAHTFFPFFFSFSAKRYGAGEWFSEAAAGVLVADISKYIRIPSLLTLEIEKAQLVPRNAWTGTCRIIGKASTQSTTLFSLFLLYHIHHPSTRPRFVPLLAKLPGLRKVRTGPLPPPPPPPPETYQFFFKLPIQPNQTISAWAGRKPEIAVETPPSVPWTFPCLCLGFTSFLSTAPSAASRSAALEIIWSSFLPFLVIHLCARTQTPFHLQTPNTCQILSIDFLFSLHTCSSHPTSAVLVLERESVCVCERRREKKKVPLIVQLACGPRLPLCDYKRSCHPTFFSHASRRAYSATGLVRACVCLD
jgi:hypothetical protein